jgi:hypothetical protein
MPQPTVQIRHPELDPDSKLDPARVSSRAYEQLYKDKGWRVVTDDGVTVPTQEEIGSLTGPELDALLPAGHGIRLVDERRQAVVDRFYPQPVPDEPLEPADDPSTGS